MNADDRNRGASFVHRLTNLKAILGVLVLIGALVAVGVLWLKDKIFSIDPGKGSPVGYAVRTDRHITVLIQTLEAYVPSLHRDHTKDTYSIGLFLVPLDGSDPRLVPIKGGLTASSYNLAKVLGSDGRALWFDAAGTGAVDLKTFRLLPPAELREPPRPPPTSALPFGPNVEHHLAAGLFASPTEWLGLYSPGDAERDLKPDRYVKRLVRATRTREPRRLYRGTVDSEATAGRHRILSMRQASAAEYVDAAFVRQDDMSEPLRLDGPAGALMIFSSDPGPKATLVVARIDLDGQTRWKTDTGLDRFTLKQILPGEASTAFLGARPPVPNVVSEPLLMIVDHRTGAMRAISLWR